VIVAGRANDQAYEATLVAWLNVAAAWALMLKLKNQPLHHPQRVDAHFLHFNGLIKLIQPSWFLFVCWKAVAIRGVFAYGTNNPPLPNPSFPYDTG